MATIPETFATAEQRERDRTAMFVAAILCDHGSHHQVRIRNMSPKGALLEAPSLPPVGSPIALVRGELTARGTIAWCRDGRAGIRLDSEIAVPDWMSIKAKPHQAEVDRRVAEARAAIAALGPSGPAPPPTPGFDLQQRPPPDEIDLIAEMIGELGDQLSGDDAVLERHGQILQSIDEAQQRLASLARQLRG